MTQDNNSIFEINNYLKFIAEEREKLNSLIEYSDLTTVTLDYETAPGRWIVEKLDMITKHIDEYNKKVLYPDNLGGINFLISSVTTYCILDAYGLIYKSDLPNGTPDVITNPYGGHFKNMRIFVNVLLDKDVIYTGHQDMSLKGNPEILLYQKINLLNMPE